jgi:chromosome segregation ATPase
MKSQLLCLALVTMGLICTGCNTMYYAVSESLLGVQKREILVNRVEDARDEQTQTKEQFQTALEKFKAVVNIDGGELEKRYNELKTEYERCESQAKAVKSRIASVENVANALFDEWQTELGQYTSPALRTASEQQLSATKARYQKMLSAMMTAQQKMQPVLNAFSDQVLFLKHNLNARAVASLQTTVTSLQSDVTRLINEMESSIDQANSFIKDLQSNS